MGGWGGTFEEVRKEGVLDDVMVQWSEVKRGKQKVGAHHGSTHHQVQLPTRCNSCPPPLGATAHHQVQQVQRRPPASTFNTGALQIRLSCIIEVKRQTPHL